MDVIKENIIKFIDAMIVDNYSKAHKFLEVVVQDLFEVPARTATHNPMPGLTYEELLT